MRLPQLTLRICHRIARTFRKDRKSVATTGLIELLAAPSTRGDIANILAVVDNTQEDTGSLVVDNIVHILREALVLRVGSIEGDIAIGPEEQLALTSAVDIADIADAGSAMDLTHILLDGFGEWRAEDSGCAEGLPG